MRSLSRVRSAIGIGATVIACGSPAHAQHRSDRWSVKAAFGPVAFIEGSGTATTAAVGRRVSAAWSVEGELTYLYASPREHAILGGVSMARSYRSEANVRPYLLVGLGVATGGRHWSGETVVTPSVGAGAQLFLSRSLFVAPEIRIGYVPEARFVVALGYVR